MLTKHKKKIKPKPNPRSRVEAQTRPKASIRSQSWLAFAWPECALLEPPFSLQRPAEVFQELVALDVLCICVVLCLLYQCAAYLYAVVPMLLVLVRTYACHLVPDSPLHLAIDSHSEEVCPHEWRRGLSGHARYGSRTGWPTCADVSCWNMSHNAYNI